MSNARKPRNGSTRKWRELRARRIRMEVRRVGRDNLRCHWCGRRLSLDAPPHTPNAVEVEHLDSVSEGHPLLAPLDRLVLSCPPCNHDSWRDEQSNEASDSRVIEGVHYTDLAPTQLVEGRWYHHTTCNACPHRGMRDDDGFVRAWLPESMSLWFGGRWWTDAEALEDQRRARRAARR